MSASRLTIETSWGPLRVSASGGAVTRCDLPRAGRATFRLGRSRVLAATAPDRVALRQADRYVRALLRGRQVARPRIDWGAASDFLVACWTALARVPVGRTVSYAGLAAAAGRPRAVRAAGQACARNPLPLFVPCHRVLAAGGRLGGFSGGLGWKTLLLAREAAAASR